VQLAEKTSISLAATLTPPIEVEQPLLDVQPGRWANRRPSNSKPRVAIPHVELFDYRRRTGAFHIPFSIIVFLERILGRTRIPSLKTVSPGIR
jgi:hypothetical protein